MIYYRLTQATILFTFTVCAVFSACADSLRDPLERPARISPLATKATILALGKAGARLVATGERGIILLSDDGGVNWRQASVPVSVSLTAVSFADERIGWAVGHGGIILKTVDGGERWKQQFDGRAIARRLSEDNTLSKASAERWLREGADKPFLALHVSDAHSVKVVGAYGLAFRSQDGGESWEYFGGKLDNPRANHLYAIAVQGRSVFIAGEQGNFFVSDDAGASFTRRVLPYKGSLFELKQTAKGIFVVGMKGKLLFTSDSARTWTDVSNPIPTALLSVAQLPSGKLLWLNQAGQLLLGSDDSQPLVLLNSIAAPSATRIVYVKDNRLVTAGFRGVGAQSWTH